MDILHPIKTRVSVRKYQNKPIPRHIVEDIADCGRLAPSGNNRQPWAFVAVTSQELRGKIADKCRYGKFIEQAGLCMAIFCSDSNLKLEDACAAAENMIIAAQAYGLGSCWVNSFRKEHAKDVEQLLNCPPDYELVVLLAIGYPDEHRQVSKKTLDEVLKWETF